MWLLSVDIIITLFTHSLMKRIYRKRPPFLFLAWYSLNPNKFRSFAIVLGLRLFIFSSICIWLILFFIYFLYVCPFLIDVLAYVVFFLVTSDFYPKFLSILLCSELQFYLNCIWFGLQHSNSKSITDLTFLYNISFTLISILLSHSTPPPASFPFISAYSIYYILKLNTTNFIFCLNIG